MSHRKQLTGRRVVPKSTGGILPSIPEPVDAVGNAAPLKSNTVAPSKFAVKTLRTSSKFGSQYPSRMIGDPLIARVYPAD
jgi:hypothetical protein